MNFIYLSFDAISQIASDHRLQNTEYDEAIALAQILNGSSTVDSVFGKVFFRKSSRGGFFITQKIDNKNGLMFDLSTFMGFNNQKDENIITIFQKVLKFCVRYFEKLPPTTCEKHLSNSTRAIVFPYPFTATKDSYKVIIDKSSNEKRFEKRELKVLLVFADGTTNDYSSTTNISNLNKALEDLPSVYSELSQAMKSSGIDNKNLAGLSTQLLEAAELTIDANIGFDQWQHYLTNSQKRFIFKDVNGPERLEGSAGTGKTLSLILRCIHVVQTKKSEATDFHAVFITHSIATKNQIESIFRSNLPNFDDYRDKKYNNVSVTIVTLQEWCIKFLGASLGNTEYLDKDAHDSKMLQKMYLEDALDKCMKNEYQTYRNLCSTKFIEYFDNTDKENILEMLQHEVSVVIKGRANENLDKYKSLKRIRYSIPCENEADLGFLFVIFNQYQISLRKTNQFDSDDIVLTALGQLDTPIWRRRREIDGFDVIFLDETHLFNLNELSIIHNLAKEVNKNNIIFTLDKSQAIGDRGLFDETLYEALELHIDDDGSNQKFTTIFRSSPEIINVAFNILSSGATLFTNFENPMHKISSHFIETEGKRSINPKYILTASEENMIVETFKEADEIKKNLNTTSSKILIVTTNELLFAKLEKYVSKNNKPVESLKSRGDTETINKASRSNRYLLGGIDYVGGLEFDGVVICGVDKGRVPTNHSETNFEALHFSNYAWHNRMYVAVTRAKYALTLIGEKSRGISPLLESTIKDNKIIVEDRTLNDLK